MNFFKKYKEELEGLMFVGVIALIVSGFGLFYLAVLFIGMWVVLFFMSLFSKNGSAAVMPMIMGIPLLVIGLVLLYFAEIPSYLAGEKIHNTSTSTNIHSSPSAPPRSVVEGNKQ